MGTRKVKNMSEFAELSGISRPTLSKYFDNPVSVRPSTRKKIEEALAQSGYRPNIHAMSLNRRKPRNIGIIVPLISDPFYAETVRQIELRCLEEGYWAIVLSSHGETELEAHAIQTLMSLNVAGAIVAPLGARENQPLFDTLGRDVPIVFFDSRMEGDYPFVGTDNGRSIALITEYLLRTGEHPSFLNMPFVNRNAEERQESYLATMKEHGAEPIVLFPPHDNWDFETAGFAATKRCLDKGGLPTKSLLCANDRMAFGAMSAAYEHGLSIGRRPGYDLLIAGHDDHPLSRYTCPGLTTVAQDCVKMAEISTDILLKRIAGDVLQASAPPAVKLEAKLIMRSSA